MNFPWEAFLLWIVVALLGGALGTAELISRYRDAPGSVLRTWPALLYIAINVGASLGAYKLAKVLGWSFTLGSSTTKAAADWSLAIVCGISAMALFRSSLFVRRIGDKDVGVGPSSFLQVFLNAADAGVDRKRAVLRASAVSRITQGLNYRKAYVPRKCLVYCKLSQNGMRGMVMRTAPSGGEASAAGATAPDGFGKNAAWKLLLCAMARVMAAIGTAYAI